QATPQRRPPVYGPLVTGYPVVVQHGRAGRAGTASRTASQATPQRRLPVYGPLVTGYPVVVQHGRLPVCPSWLVRHPDAEALRGERLALRLELDGAAEAVAAETRGHAPDTRRDRPA